MPIAESPSLYIDFARLPPPKVVETIDYEDLLAAYKARVLASNAKLAAALNLEQSPASLILETQAYGEMLVRARVNAAARAVMLPFATGSDLDVLAAFYDVPRMAASDGTAETDDRFRHRVQLASEAFTAAGSAGAYVFHAMSADGGLRDATALKIDDRGGVKVTLMNGGADPRPTQAQVDAVSAALSAKAVRPLTDVVSVSGPRVSPAAIAARLTLYDGPDAAVVLASVQVALTSLRARLAQLGRSLTRSALVAALNQEGVQNVDLVSPAADIPVGLDGCVLITGATVDVLPQRRE